ncbi:conjugal transfer protein TraG N-terminal domain-containing protein [Aeromonas caviae]|uniref:conjugal transfer protein TraG N-terminal domain-containing protein n=1 Tax=Aeromonas caviae TaxID=648 RepID=UPI0029D629C9|nr:conjugal transfer protein TraG N-terminal domain-containing protein [Aeromonas caviae]MDX7789035.1 conjugal transfer protein TraG N-terminal domain-containing protein [Aeromonas caviae]
MFEIISVGGGDELVRVLNAVVMTAGQSSFSTLAKLAFIFGLISSLAFIAMQSQAWTNFIKYFIGAFLFFNVVVVPKTTVYVTDVANPAVTGVKVDNVPYGLAYLISTAMSVDYTYGRSVDLAFSLPTDLRYSESGVLLGNTIIKQASQVVVGNVRTAKNMRSFLQNCVIFDLQIGKFTYEDLFKAPDLWGFITSKENSVKSRMYDHNGTMETCAAGTVKLSTELNGEVDSALQQLSNVVFPGRTSTAAKQQLVNVIPVAYETLVGISVQAEDVVKQGMVANLMLDAAQEYTASTDADAASRAFAEARMQLTTRQTLMMSSMQASTWIGYQKTVWLLILTGAFIITAPLAMLPGGIKKFIVTYVAGFFWLSSWGMMYAILNSIMYSKGAAEFQTAGASISMMSMIGHKVVSENLAMTAASMIDKVPWMAAAFTGLMGGLGMGVSNLVSQQMQIAGAVAKDMADGNISLGNTNAGNHSWNNQNANKLDLSRRMVGPGNMLEVSSNGVEVSTHADGSKSLKAPETTGAVNVQATEQIGAALTSEASRYKEQGTSLVNEGVRTQSKVTSNVMETMWSKYNDSSDATSTRDSQTQSASKAASKVKSIVEKATEGMNISERDRAELIGMVSVGMKTPGWSPVSLAANLQVQGSHARDISRMRDVATELAKNKEFRSSLEEVISFAKERNLTLSSGSHNSQTGSTREAYETSDQQIQRGSEQISQGERLSQAAERFKRADTSVQANLNDAFVNWLKDTGKSDQQVTELFSPKRVAELQMYAATFADQYAQQQVNSLLGKQHPGLPASPSGLSTASYPPPAPGNIGEQPQPRATATATATAQYSSEQHAPPQTFERAQLLPANGQALATDTTQFRSDQPAAPQAPVVPASGQPQPLATDTAQFRTDNVSAPQTFERVQVLPAYGQPQPLANDTAQIRSEQPTAPQASVVPANGQPQPLATDTPQFRSEQPAAPQTPVMPASGQPQPLATDTAQFRSEQPTAPQAPVVPANGQPQPLATDTAQFRSEQLAAPQSAIKQSLQNDGERAYLEKGNAMQSDWETKLSSFSDTPMIGDRNKTQGDRDVARSIFKTSPDNATEGDIDQKLKEARDPEKFNLLKSDLDHNAEEKVYVPTKPKPPRQYDYLLGSVPKQEPGTPALTREEVIQQAATERTASVAAHQAQAHPTVSPISVADQFNQPVHMGSTPSPVQQQDVRGMVEQAVAAQQRGSGSASSGFDIFGGDSKHSTDAKPAVEISHDSLVKEGAPLPKR